MFFTFFNCWGDKEYLTEIDLMWLAKLKTFILQPFQKEFAYSQVRKGKVN